MKSQTKKRIASIVDEAEAEAASGIQNADRLLADLAAAEQRMQRKVRGIQWTSENREKLVDIHRDLFTMKQQLVFEKEQCGLQANLRRLGSVCWPKLTEQNRWKKGNVLAFLSSGRLFEFNIFGMVFERDAPESIRRDRDILLARLDQECFDDNTFLSRSTVFRIPEPLLDDKEVVAAAVNRCPEVLQQEGLSREYLDDEDIFWAYIRSPRWKNGRFSGGCDRKTASNLISKFSARLRGNASLMLEAGKVVKKSAFLHLGGELSKDPTFAMELLKAFEPARQEYSFKKNVPDNALACFSDAVRSNPEVVLAFVRNNGLCLQGADAKLRGQEQIVRAACAEDACAFFFCAPGPTKCLLLADRALMLRVLKAFCFESSESKECIVAGGYPLLYNGLPLQLKLDREIIHVAKRTRRISLPGDLPPSLARNREFWLEMVGKYSLFWHHLPAEFKDDQVFVRAIVNFEQKATIKAIFEHFPSLSDDRAIWSTIIEPDLLMVDDGDYGDLPYDLDEVIQDYAPSQIRQDRELMLRAVARAGSVLEHLPADLQVDREFIECLVETDCPLAAMSADAQRLYPDLVVASLKECQEYNIDGIVEFVAPELWLNIEVWKKYFKAGGWDHDHCPDEIKDDEEFGLLAAEQASDEEDFEALTSVALRSNKCFMMKAVQINAVCFLGADGDLRRDYDLAVTALGCPEKGSQVADGCLADFDDVAELNFLRRVLSNANEKIKAHEGYLAGLLFGMSACAGPETSLSMLVVDMETSVALKKTIASYLGTPSWKDVAALRRAVKNLSGLVYDEKLWTG